MNIEYVAEKLEDISKALGNIQELDKEQALIRQEVEDLKKKVDNSKQFTVETVVNNQEIDGVFRERFERLMKNYLRTKEAQGSLEDVVDTRIADNNEKRDLEHTKREAEQAAKNNKFLLKVIGTIVTAGIAVAAFLFDTGALKIVVGG